MRFAAQSLGDIVRDPLVDVTADWTAAIADLVSATQAMLRNTPGAILDAQDAITRGSRAASSVGGMTNGVLTAALQTTNQRWLTALEQYQAAYNTLTGEHAELPYNPNDALVTRRVLFTPDGMNVGSMTIPWWALVLGAAGSLYAASKSKGGVQW